MVAWPSVARRHCISIESAFPAPHRWNGRPASKVLPFFSKVNLRQRTIELERLGFSTALAMIDYP